MDRAISAYVRQCADHAMDDILGMMTVRSVLDEMVNDVEVWELENERIRLAAELHHTKALLTQATINERLEWDHKQKMVQQMHTYRIQGKELALKLQKQVQELAFQVAQHKNVEDELEEAKEKLASMGSLTRELARTQREIRDIHRKQGLQNLLRPSQNQSIPRSPVLTGFLRCPDKVLMVVFSYLTAYDVMRMSMTSKPWKLRISTLFGVEPPIKIPTIAPPIRKPSTISDKSQLAKADEVLKNLSNREMKYFHDLILRMKQLEGSVAQLKAEKEDVGARLQAAEDVRDFLMEKLKDLEEALALSMEEKSKADAQFQLDREVLAYLDAKSQELEDELNYSNTQCEELKAHLERIIREHQSKTQVMEDMLRHISLEKHELETHAKTQKKLLIKEVRTLRAENARLNRDNQTYRDQLSYLKRALLDQID
ncbi:hypothetical protein THRCLA_09614 [Thraustotheca clavata]|uniref:F-box domain-containing protein n=1 Tax=Thraustotheca clavata TaxID=74557 RepID=A0A1V9YVQ0_9STRA|nr:hypothetical protein THRCLA_09614 [Thraustotheca clavata]